MQQKKEEKANKTRRYKIRSRRCQLIHLFGQAQPKVVEKDEEVVVGFEVMAFLCALGTPGAMRMADNLGEVV
jgi:hypothetical protein